MEKQQKHIDQVYEMCGAPVGKIAEELENDELSYGLVTVDCEDHPLHGMTGYYDDDSWEPYNTDEFMELTDQELEEMTDSQMFELGCDCAIVYFDRPFVDGYILVEAHVLRPAEPAEALAYNLKLEKKHEPATA